MLEYPIGCPIYNNNCNNNNNNIIFRSTFHRTYAESLRVAWNSLCWHVGSVTCEKQVDCVMYVWWTVFDSEKVSFAIRTLVPLRIGYI